MPLSTINYQLISPPSSVIHLPSNNLLNLSFPVFYFAEYGNLFAILSGCLHQFLIAMIQLSRTNATDPAFIQLVQQLDAELAQRHGADHSFYAAFNSIAAIRYAVLASENGRAVACGAIKEMAPGIMEVKRMYTLPESRGRGIAGLVLAELEQWARELGFQSCVLETGKRQPEAISLYTKCGYRVIPNYGQYAAVENSVCFEKILS